MKNQLQILVSNLCRTERSFLLTGKAEADELLVKFGLLRVEGVCS
jgi:hypothetical protein